MRLRKANIGRDKREGKRRRRRWRHKPAPFGQIVYWYETSQFADIRAKAKAIYGSDVSGETPIALYGKIKYVPRTFPSYEEAVTHLTNVKLGLEKEIYPWIYYRACKIVEGYRRNGRKVVQKTTIIEEPRLKELHERTSLGQFYPRSRLLRPSHGISTTVPQNMGVSAYRTATYVSGGDWPVTRSSSTKTVDGTGTRCTTFSDYYGGGTACTLF